MKKFLFICLAMCLSYNAFAQVGSQSYNQKSTQNIVKALDKDKCYTNDGQQGRLKQGTTSTTKTTTTSSSNNSGSSSSRSINGNIGTSGVGANGGYSNTRSSGSTTTTTTTTTTTSNTVCVPIRKQ